MTNIGFPGIKIWETALNIILFVVLVINDT